MAGLGAGWHLVGGNSFGEEKEEAMPVMWDGVLVGTWHNVYTRTVTVKIYEQRTYDTSFDFVSLVSGDVKTNDAQRSPITNYVVEKKTVETKTPWVLDPSQSRYEQAPAAPNAPSE